MRAKWLKKEAWLFEKAAKSKADIIFHDCETTEFHHRSLQLPARHHQNQILISLYRQLMKYAHTPMRVGTIIPWYT